MSEYVVLIGVSKRVPANGDELEARILIEVDTLEQARNVADAVHDSVTRVIDSLKAEGWAPE